MTHSKVLNADEETLCYFEEQGAYAMDILLLCCLCDSGAQRKKEFFHQEKLEVSA